MSTDVPRGFIPTPQRLSTLTHLVGGRLEGPDTEVTGLNVDSRSVDAGDLFVAVAGAHSHGIDFWPQAKEAGAVAVLTDEVGYAAVNSADDSVIVVARVREVLGALASAIYETDGPGLPDIYAVTGTNGKTSTSYLLDALLRGLGGKTALSTTAERHVSAEVYPSILTTPEAPDLHAMLGLAKKRDVDAFVIEVSAQALDRHRFDNVVADVAGFTNLSHDHLDDFGTIDNYFEVKTQLFLPARARQAVVCVDTSWGQKLAERISIPAWTVGSTSSQPVAGREHWVYRTVESDLKQTTFGITSPQGVEILVTTSLIGDHMVANAALAIAMVVKAGIDFQTVGEVFGPGSPGIQVVVPGRIERVSGETGPQVFVDSGVSVDSYRWTLTTIRQRTPGRLIMMFGTGGDRDPTKRFAMGAEAAKHADIIIVTDDDSRTENPAAIRAALMEGVLSVPGVEAYEVAHPSDAIRVAVSHAGDGDAVVWSGPGAQHYRDVGGEKIPYSARDEARQALVEAGWPRAGQFDD